MMGLESTATAESIRDRYQHLFDVTDKENGGSFYIQSKVVMAKEAVDLVVEPLPLEDAHLEEEAEEVEEEERAAHGEGGGGDDSENVGGTKKKSSKSKSKSKSKE